MSYDTKKNTITVNDVTYNVEREPDRGSPEETLTLRDYDVATDEFINPFPGLSATLGMEEYIEEYMSPRDWCNVGTMAVSYSGYNLGDEDISEINFEIECDKCDGSGETIGPENMVGGYFVRPPNCPHCEGVGMVDIHPAEYFKREQGARVVIGLTVYEHSGITMRAGNVTLPWDTDRWDTSFVGFIYDTPEGVKQCLGDNATDEQIEAALRAEVEVYASFLEGDVSFYVVQDDETDFMESCGGYVGAAEQAEQECFAALEQAIIKRLSENEERAEWNARGTTTQ